MLRYILTKILNKYKLYLCLMIGNISIIMIFSMMIMFRDGSRVKLIQKGFTKQYEQTGTFPAVISRTGAIRGDDLASYDGANLEYVDKEIDSYQKSWEEKLQLPILASERITLLKSVEAEYSYRGNGHIGLGILENGDGHYNVISGADFGEDISSYTENGVAIPDGAYPCLISQYTADALDLVPGEVIYIKKIIYGTDESDKPLVNLYVSGIISENPEDYYWSKSLEEFGFVAFMNRGDIESILANYPKDTYYEIYNSLDYRVIEPDRMNEIEIALKQFKEKDEGFDENITPVIREYRKNSKSVEQMLYVIVLPIIVLILIFIGMISFRIIDSENGELTNFKNRGLSKGRIIGMYVLQSFVLVGVSLPLGLLAGYFFGKLMAGVTDFMGFSFGDSGISVTDYRFTFGMVLSAIIASFIAVIIMIIPVIKYFSKKKVKRKNSSDPVWEKYFIDLSLLGVSIYLLINYNKQAGVLSSGVLNGEGIDPIIFINTTLFLFACGMLMLRLIFYLVKLAYKLGERKFKPVVYAGMLQILRTRNASALISIFLVMTVAMSLFNANMARTINANKEERIVYNCGADFRIQEHWIPTIVGPPENRKWKYNEPTFAPYEELVESGNASSITKVLISDRPILKVKGKETPDVTLMGIHTKEFGETAILKDGISKEHWFNYLNALAVETEGVIISENLADLYELKVGDSIHMEMRPPRQTGMKDAYATADFKVVAIVDAWPGYNRYKYIVEEADDSKGKSKIIEKENYLAVINYGSATSHFSVLPYEVWAKSDAKSEDIEKRLSESYGDSGRRLDGVISWRKELKEEKSSAIIQITNGLFTANFLIALILCIIGYMIYWITSIRDRELLFGIYRAMGISRKEINSMLGIEQLFLSLMSIFAGIFAGMLASKIFVKVFAAVYLPEKHNLPLFTSSYGGDLIKMGAVLLVVIVICIIWISRIVSNLKITEALKLGDD